jgi:hypothetical protein
MNKNYFPNNKGLKPLVVDANRTDVAGNVSTIRRLFCALFLISLALAASMSAKAQQQYPDNEILLMFDEESPSRERIEWVSTSGWDRFEFGLRFEMIYARNIYGYDYSRSIREARSY